MRTGLGRFAPAQDHEFLKGNGYELSPYHWGLNDQDGKGKDYSTLDLYWDKIIGACKSSGEKKK